MDRRRHLRIKTQFDALFAAGSQEGSGTLSEISYTGLRLDGVLNPPKEGTLVRIYIFIQPVAPFEVAGHVAWTGENCFALHYDNFDEATRQLVEDIASIVASPETA